MNRVLRFLVFIICCGVSISCEKDSVELKERFKQEAQARWLLGPRSYDWYSPGFSVSRDYCLSEQEYTKWLGLEIAAGRVNDSRQMREAYLDEMIRKPEQLRIRATHNRVSRYPGSSFEAPLNDWLEYCTERYINQCIKSGKYREYLSIWDAISNSDVVYFGDRFFLFSYSDVSIVSMDIVSSEAFFKQRPGSSLSQFFRVVLFPSTEYYLVDGDGNFVEDGPKGGKWYHDYVQVEDDEYVFMKVDEFVSYRPRIIPFALQMAKAPTERPSSAEFTVTIGYSDGTKSSSTLSVGFPY